MPNERDRRVAGAGSRLVSTSLIGWMCLCGCGPESADLGGGAAFETRDSLGVTIALSRTPVLSDATAWSVSPEPILQIGQVEGEPAYQFTQIWNALRSDDGHIIVSEGREYEIRVFDPEGVHLTTIGRRGQGPGEFGGPPWIAMAPEGTIVAWDAGQYRLSWFDLAGRLVDEVSLAPVMATLPGPRPSGGPFWNVVGDGTLLWMGLGSMIPTSQPQTIMRAGILIGNRGGRVHNFGLFPMDASIRIEGADGRGTNVMIPWAPSVSLALGGRPTQVAIGDEAEWEVRVYGIDGSLERILRADIPRAPLIVMTRSAGPVEQALSSITPPDSAQAIASLLWDSEGSLWVSRSWGGGERPAVLYDVFDADGRWVTTVPMPVSLGRIMDIGADHILFRRTDALGVPSLGVHPFSRSGPPQ